MLFIASLHHKLSFMAKRLFDDEKDSVLTATFERWLCNISSKSSEEAGQVTVFTDLLSRQSASTVW